MNAVAIVAIVAMLFGLLAYQLGTSAERRPDTPSSAEVILYIDPPFPPIPERKPVASSLKKQGHRNSRK